MLCLLFIEYEMFGSKIELNCEVSYVKFIGVEVCINIICLLFFDGSYWRKCEIESGDIFSVSFVVRFC